MCLIRWSTEQNYTKKNINQMCENKMRAKHRASIIARKDIRNWMWPVSYINNLVKKYYFQRNEFLLTYLSGSLNPYTGHAWQLHCFAYTWNQIQDRQLFLIVIDERNQQLELISLSNQSENPKLRKDDFGRWFATKTYRTIKYRRTHSCMILQIKFQLSLSKIICRT